MDDNLLKHLEYYNFGARLEKLKRFLKNKSIVIYGAGKLFETIIENFDLSSLNIIAISDIKFSQSPYPEKYLGYDTIAPDDIIKLNPDCVLCSTRHYVTLIKNLKKSYPKLKNRFIPFAKYPSIYRLYNFLYKYLPDCKYKTIINMKRKGNKFYIIHKDGKKTLYPDIKGLKINFSGYRAKIIIHDDPLIKFYNTKILCGDDAIIEIKSSKYFIKNTSIHNTGKKCTIDENFSMQGGEIYIYHNENMTIGKDCMFSYNVRLRTSDGHTIYDNDTNELLNKNKDIIIDDHVWLGCEAAILKGVYIAPNCIVGAKSLVNKEFKTPNCTIAGIPARVIKENINWDITNPYYYEKKQSADEI